MMVEEVFESDIVILSKPPSPLNDCKEKWVEVVISLSVASKIVKINERQL
jgi:hypothetical protein